MLTLVPRQSIIIKTKVLHTFVKIYNKFENVFLILQLKSNT